MSVQTTPDASPADRIRAIDARIRARQTELGLADEDRPEYGFAALPVSDATSDPETRALIAHLTAVYWAFRNPPIELNLAPSPATKLPLIGPLWARVREGAHKLPLFYVQRAAERQTAVQRALISALNLLTTRVQRQRAELAELRAARDRRAAR
jgi:hypothetical protein